jgi:hypothetical protein
MRYDYRLPTIDAGARIAGTVVMCAVIACCAVLVQQAHAFPVANEDFQDDLGSIGGGNGTANPSLKGLPTDQGNDLSKQEGRWVSNGYDMPPGGPGDTNPNLTVSSLPLGALPLLPDGNPTGFQGFYEARPFDYAMSGILQFTDSDGNPVTANAGDRLVGEFQILLQNGGFSFCFVDDIPGLQDQQFANSWTGTPPPNPVDIPNPQSGGPYFSNITAMVHVRSSGTAGAYAAVNDGGNVMGVRLEDEITPGPLGGIGKWQNITFDYTVGSNEYSNLSVETFVNVSDIGQGITTNEVRVLSDGSAVPVGDVRTSVVAIVFSGGDGGNTDYWVDEIHIDLIPASVPSVPFTNVVVNGVMELDFLSAAGRTYTLESTEDPVAVPFTPFGETLVGTGGLMVFTDTAPTPQGKVYRIREEP